MNKTGLEYLRYRLEIAKECEADSVKIDIEELASALCEVDEFLASDKMIVNRDDFTEDLINQGYNKALREFAMWFSEITRTSELIRGDTETRRIEDFNKWKEQMKERG